MKSNLGKPKICIVGLGYVGLPLAEAFSKHFTVIGYDSNSNRIDEVYHRHSNQLIITSDPQLMNEADFIIITVPTPVTPSKEPDLSHIRAAAAIVRQNMKQGCTVVLESTVYPGVTREILQPILEESGLKCGKDFGIGYSPERINPGDDEHTIEKGTKVVSAMDEETTERLAQLYDTICESTYKAENIETAEAAKVIENCQRDLNIALINELTLIFNRMGLNTRDVLNAAATKWNFHRYSPGLVGGHCIPVDPYYMVYRARELDYHPQVILAGRAINDSMPKYIAEMAMNALNEAGKVLRKSRILIMGLTYKENVPDMRHSPAIAIARELLKYETELFGYDPYIDKLHPGTKMKLVTNPKDAAKVDCIIITVAHKAFGRLELSKLNALMNDRPVLIDVRGVINRDEAAKAGFIYRTL